jgi:ABC-type transport system substrate-binding protein
VNFPEAWTTQIGVVMPMESIEGDNAKRAQEPIGTGPFVFDEWIQDRSLRVVRNDDYWQEGLPYLEEIEFRPISDPTTRAASLLSGDIDMAQLEEPQEMDQFLDNDDFVVWQDARAETAERFAMLNTLEPPFDDPRVRQALAYATDKETVNEATAEGLQELANGPYRPSSPWYTDTDYPQYDPAMAQQLVDEYEAEVGPIEFTMEVGVSGAIGQQIAQLLQQQWGQVGIDVELGTTEVASLIANVVVGDYQAVLWRQFDSPTPLQETVWWHEEGATDLGDIGLNFARNRNDTLSAALDASRTVETDADEKAQFDVVQQQLNTDIPYIWVTHIEPAIVAETGVINVLHAPIPDSDVQMASFHNSSHLLSQVWVRSDS